MPTPTEHTPPVPWQIHINRVDKRLDIVGTYLPRHLPDSRKDFHVLASIDTLDESDPRARVILHAVNSHGALVGALRELTAHCEAMGDDVSLAYAAVGRGTMERARA